MARLSKPNIAIAGATGAVGQEFLRLFEERGTAHGELRLLASARSAGKTTAYRGEQVPIAELRADSFDGIDVALFSAGGDRSKEFGPAAVEAGAVVIDNSSAFRMTDGVPLVIPEINGALADGFEPGIIANPNCSTIIMLVPLEPIRRAFGVERVIVSTYQAVSGAGAAAMVELDAQTRAVLDGRQPQTEIFGEVCAFSVFSHDTTVDPQTGRNVEEQKMIDETRKIWGDPSVSVSPTCIRVPVMRAHAESIHVTTRDACTEDELRAALDSGEGIELCDDRAGNSFPTPLKASGRDPVLIGRVRPAGTNAGDVTGGRYREWELFVCGDQLRKGAALNAVQIMERVLG